MPDDFIFASNPHELKTEEEDIPFIFKEPVKPLTIEDEAQSKTRLANSALNNIHPFAAYKDGYLHGMFRALDHIMKSNADIDFNAVYSIVETINGSMPVSREDYFREILGEFND